MMAIAPDMEAVETLGQCAATCDLAAADPTITRMERERLEYRARRYQEMQMEELKNEELV